MTIAPIIRHVTSQPNVCERAIKAILLACLQAQQLQRNHRRARPRGGAFWLHSTAVFAGAGLPTRSTDFAVRCNYIRNGWRYRPPPECSGWRRWRRSPLFELLLRACLRPGNTRDTCAHCARNTCDLLPTVYLLSHRPTMANIHTCVFRTLVKVVAVEANKISANKIYIPAQ